jgi:hypothetical protein
MNEFGVSLTINNNANRVVSYTPRVVNYAARENIYSCGITQEDRHMTIIMFIV